MPNDLTLAASKSCMLQGQRLGHKTEDSVAAYFISAMRRQVQPSPPTPCLSHVAHIAGAKPNHHKPAPHTLSTASPVSMLAPLTLPPVRSRRSLAGLPRRLVIATPVAPGNEQRLLRGLLFGLCTQMCGSCVAAVVSASEGDR